MEWLLLRRVSRFFFVALVFCCGVTFAQQAPGSVATPVASADAACGQCHAKILHSYLATPMANASGLATERAKPGVLEHKASGIRYSLSSEDGRFVLSYQDPKSFEIPTSRGLDYILGSGHLGLTYLYSLNHYLFESPVAWYAASQSLDMKPGVESATQAPPALPVQAECLRCHMSAVHRSDPGSLNRYSGLPFLHTGITCESCHGDTRSHLASGGKAAVVNPSKLTAERRDSVCISCHLEGDVSVERAGRSALDYMPGDSISDYLSYFVFKGQGATQRGVSEVEQLGQSMCKRSSGDAMSCTSCHDPHFTPAPEEKAAYYRGKCLTCHTGPRFASAHHPENPDCASCHMQRVGAANIAHVAWTDHRILRVPSRPDATAAKSETLVPVFSPAAGERDLAVAYYKAVLEGNASLQQKAYDSLLLLRSGLSHDNEALVALGILSEERGDLTQAQQLFRQVLQADPVNLTALSNLGTLLGRSGDVQGAITLWRPAFERNEATVGLAKNLALVECAAGDATAARATLETALQYSPGLREVVQLLGRVSNCNDSR